MKLLVAEKPSVANQHYTKMLERVAGEKFQKKDGYLQGKEYCITWCVGHLVTLAPFDQYPGYSGLWKLDNLPHLPQQFKLIPIEQTKKQLGIVQNLMQQADTLINGADAGREGNLIFDLVLDFNPSFKQKDIKRLWVNSYVGKELDAAWNNLESSKHRENLSYAARLRQRADWMVGLNATRGYTLTAGHGKLISVGRVQTPTLNLIVQRDFIVENFKEFFNYGLKASWRDTEALWYREDKIAFFEESKVPLGVKEKCENQLASIAELDTITKKKFPPKPFDLTELQKEANKRFKFKVQKVLDLAQDLYEKKFITYPRTDSQYLNDAMKDESYQLALSLSSDQEKNLLRAQKENFVFINSKKVSDHYAIIPTGETPQNLNEDESKIYQLVKERFITAWMKPYIWEEYQAKLICQNEDFRTKLKRVKQLGFTEIQKQVAVENKKKKSDTNENNSDNGDDESKLVEIFPNWSVGDSTIFDSIDLYKKKKSKPKYHTEATLLTAMKSAGKEIDNEDLAEAMKDRGLGTPATQAGIIETLKKRGFIEEKKNNLISTETGRQVISYMDERIKSPEMTGDWEYKLSQIEKGLYSPADFRDEIMVYVRELFNSLKSKYQNEFNRELETENLTCPKCKNSLEMRPWGYVCEKADLKNKSGDCDFKISHTIAQKSLSHADIKSLLEKKQSDVLTGFISKKGSGFSAALKINNEWEVEFDFDKIDQEAVVLTEKCPKCQNDLKDFGARISCVDEKCNFVLWKKIAGRTLDQDEIKMLLNEHKTELLKGFISKKNSSFSAKIIFDENFNTTFVFDNEGGFGGEETSYACPICSKLLKENPKTIFCDQKDCSFVLFKNIAGKKISSKHIKQLFKDKKTEEIKGFKSKKGNVFDAELIIDSEYKVSFNFNNNHSSNNSNTSSSQHLIQDIFSKPCYKCGSPMNKSKTQLYCTEGACGLSFPLSINQKNITDEIFIQLFKDKKTTVIEKFYKNDKAFKASLILTDEDVIKFDPKSAELLE